MGKTEPYSISAGLDYPGVGPMHNLTLTGRAQFISITDEQVQWGLKLSKMEGIIPAIETAHFAVLDEMKFKPEDIVVINLSGRGDKDLNTYIDYFKL
jgi:tryptophan synthase beta chain